MEGGRRVDAVSKACFFGAGLRSRVAGDCWGVAAFGCVKDVALGQEERDLIFFHRGVRVRIKGAVYAIV